MAPRCQRARAIRKIAWTSSLSFTLAVLLLPPRGDARADTSADLGDLSIEALMQIEVTSVSKHAQPLAEAAAAVTVLNGEDLRRSGFTSIPEALRLVPGLSVASIDANKWAITARGFNSQFANKLLVLIDGRSVYTPLFSGVWWDVQDVPMEDIERIEVVRGPGGTLWGANAVNGVINIITKSAKDTQGWLASGGGGSLEQGFGTLRYGGELNPDAHLRGYLKYFNRGDFKGDSTANANDKWEATRGGFRLDWDLTPDDLLTFQGDYYDGESHGTLVTGADDQDDPSGGNLLARWTHTLSETSEFTSQFYYDRTERDLTLLSQNLDTVDLEFQHRFAVSDWHDLIWGAGYRRYMDDVSNKTLGLAFTPTDRNDNVASAFFQNEFSLLEDSLKLIIGSKFEYNDYTDFEFQPNARALWRPDEKQSVWAAVSRAVRTPSRADEDVFFLAPTDDPLTFNTFTGQSGFDSEEVLSLELGYRAQPVERVSFDIATYYSFYNDLRSTEIAGPPIPFFPCPICTTIPLTLDNKIDAETYGVELSTTWHPTDFWELSGSYTLMMVDVDPDNDSTDTTAKDQEDDTPDHQFQLHSRLNLPYDLEFDTSFYYVSKLSSQNVGSYERVDARLAWHPREHLELSVVGQNLFEGKHREFGDGFFTVSNRVPRSVYGKVTWRY